MILRFFLFLTITHYSLFTVQAQCITSFPYSEDFEASNGNWVSGGTGDDWAWGAVSKAYIQTAFSGSNCWVTGGLTNSFYNLGELSYVQSPCFDFSGMQNPYIRFNIYWETENTYDGAGFQYSTDGGTTWQNVGAYSPVQCINNSWFNNSNVNYLGGFTSVRHGWSGNAQSSSGGCQGGGGSGGWKNASQCMPYLAGQSNVLFRFIFGAGTQCNNYDGFAFDDVYISDAPTANFDFTYSCNGDFLTVTPVITPQGYDCYDSVFISIDNLLKMTGNGGLISFTYNVAAPGQGLAPAFPHLTSIRYKGICHNEVTVTKLIPDFNYNVTTISPTCPGSSDGMAIINFTGGTLPRHITWNSTPGQQNDTAYNLPAGNYTAILIDSFNCVVPIDTYTLSATPAINPGINASITADTCGLFTGCITSNTTGGTAPYQYIWSNGGSTSAITGLAQGDYQLTVTDANTCSVTAAATVPYESGILLALGGTNIPCRTINAGEINVTPAGGTQPYNYTWSNAATTPAIRNLSEGIYTVTVTDAAGCSVTGAVTITADYCPSFIYFPTAFSPNGDGSNEVFKPRYSDDLDKFSIQVYNRWGELLFESKNVKEGWDGVFKGTVQPLSVYTWTSQYSFLNGKEQTQSGNVTLVR